MKDPPLGKYVPLNEDSACPQMQLEKEPGGEGERRKIKISSDFRLSS